MQLFFDLVNIGWFSFLIMLFEIVSKKGFKVFLSEFLFYVFAKFDFIENCFGIDVLFIGLLQFL